MQKKNKVLFSQINGANHFFKDKEKELGNSIIEYIKDKVTII